MKGKGEFHISLQWFQLKQYQNVVRPLPVHVVQMIGGMLVMEAIMEESCCLLPPSQTAAGSTP